MSTTPESGPDTEQDKPLHPQEQARLEQVARYPFVAITVQTTGIHPSTGRLVTIDALTYDAAGAVGQEFHAVLNPDTDPGPRHQHGLSAAEIEAGQRFSRILKPLNRLIDGRTLVVHDATYVWGFLVSEAKRAMTAAARANRSRSRGKNRRRRQKVGHVPAPVAITDTLLTARRRGIPLADVRLGAVAAASGLDTPDYRASVQRAARTEEETSRESTRLLLTLERHQATTPGTLASLQVSQLRGDRFGLQRSHLRVDAAMARRVHVNPGKFKGQLRRGMEFVVTPEISMDPDDIIAAGVKAGLNYVEKLSRESSFVVCNLKESDDLKGKAMHAQRKNIPLISDADFFTLLDNVAEALPGEQPTNHLPGTRPLPRIPRRSVESTGSSKSHKRRRGTRGGNRRRRGKGGAE